MVRYSDIRVCMTLSLILSLSSLSFAVINTNGENGVVRTQSAKTYGKASMNVGVGITFQQANDYMKGPVENGVTTSVVGPDGKEVNGTDDARLFSSNVFFGISPLSFWDISMALPFYYDWSGIDGVQDGGLGDLVIATKLGIPALKKVVRQAYYISTTIPVGMKKNGLFPRHSYYIDDKNVNPAASFYSTEHPTIKALLVMSFDVGTANPKVPVEIDANLGGVLSISSEQQRNTVVGGLAVTYTPADFISLFVDLQAESRFSNFSSGVDPTNDPVYISPGFKINTPSGMYLQFAGDFSLSSKSNDTRLNWQPKNGGGENYNYSTSVIPSYGVQFLIGWNNFITVQDDDKDGIKNDQDRCPKDAEDIDGFNDNDGCPDLDNDNDGIADLKDKCPNDPEDKDGFQDEDGCPDLDNDGDGIADTKDLCPLVAEDFDGFEDKDGCLDPDNDKDGVVDSLDKCPNEVEDFDGFQDDDGCPDKDNDKDGIPDLKDKCPNDAESFNGFEDTDGCPDTLKKEVNMEKQQIIHGIVFKSGSPDMTFESFQYLDPILKKLKQYPEVEIEVRGHTDSVGNFAKNMQLSQMRAEAVRQYLISKGIEAARIRAVGLGSSSPVADNRTAAGRAQNRRIEIVRLK